MPAAELANVRETLKREPLEVPSTYLWHKSIEDLHVNSIWQRLRRSLLLLLQLLFGEGNVLIQLRSRNHFVIDDRGNAVQRLRCSHYQLG